MFLQLSVILAACRVVGIAGRRLGQTQVVSEMVAGVLLGPSLFGWLLPDLQSWLFPKIALVGPPENLVTIVHPSMSILYVLSQIGLVFYMFLVGLEFDPSLLRGRFRSAGLVSASGIIVPFVLGGVLGMMLVDDGDLFSGHIEPFNAALYLGASMSITAFPMLARILHERDITHTRMGTIALAAGSLDDAIAWCLLAIVLASLQSSPSVALLAIGGGIVFALGMITIGRRNLASFQRSFEKHGLSVTSFTALLLVVMLAAWLTDIIGIYAVFGAFIVGASMPRGAFAEAVRQRTELLTTSLFLPIFFVYSGLNTEFGLVRSVRLWILTGVVVLIAILGKGVACAMAARAGGEGWGDSVRIGVLMNARGLMELIILNIGLEKGVVTPTLFTIMALMAILTTLMTSPLFEWLSRGEAVKSNQ